MAISILLSPALLIVDHIHFQYNGFLYGILILSLVLARQTSTILLSGLLFAALLCLKHIYLYLAPAYFVFLLRTYCLSRSSIFQIQFNNCIKLGSGLLLVFGAAFGPFAYWGQLDQVLTRLFPFSRGLCHAYWAPNVWAMYSFSDRVLIHSKLHTELSIDKADHLKLHQRLACPWISLRSIASLEDLLEIHHSLYCPTSLPGQPSY